MSAPILELCLYRIAENFELTADLIKQLGPGQRQRMASLSPARQRQFVSGRLLMAGMLQRFHKLGVDAWLLQEREGLPPLLSLARENYPVANVPDFSISHTGDMVIVAMRKAGRLSPCQLGVDIETVKQRRKITTADYFCSHQELQELGRLADLKAKLDYLTRVWTQKEAFFKARELPILNSRLKELYIVDSAANHGNIRTSSITQNTIISIYCPAGDSISAQWVTIDRQGKLARLAPADLRWRSYLAEFNSR